MLLIIQVADLRQNNLNLVYLDTQFTANVNAQVFFAINISVPAQFSSKRYGAYTCSSFRRMHCFSSRKHADSNYAYRHHHRRHHGIEKFLLQTLGYSLYCSYLDKMKLYIVFTGITAQMQTITNRPLPEQES